MTFPSTPTPPTSPPAAPQRSDPDPTFSSKADAFVAWFSPFTTWLQNFVTYIGQFITELGIVQVDITTKSNSAATSAANAATSEANALASANVATNAANNPSYTGTSTTTLTVGYGSKTFTTQSGKNWAQGMSLRAYSVEGYQMIGVITSYTSTTLIMDIHSVNGLGSSSSSWSIGYYNFDAEKEAFLWSISLN